MRINNQIIAVWGNSEAGKTSFSIKLARALALAKKNVVLIFTDVVAPTLSYVLPQSDLGNKSLGALLDLPDIAQDDILKYIITLKNYKYIGLLGYLHGENALKKYAKYMRPKAHDLLIQARQIADVVIVDCSSNFDTLSEAALEKADLVFRLASANLKASSFFASQLVAVPENQRHIKILSNVKSFEPVREMEQLYLGVDSTTPYVHEIELQMLEGELFEPLKSKDGKSFMAKIEELIERYEIGGVI